MAHSQNPPPPETHEEFLQHYPELGDAWALIGKAGEKGPLDERTVRLIKLAVAIGAMREGAVHANVRKALAAGIPAEQLEQVVAAAAGTIGLPGAVAAYSWVRDLLPNGKV